MDHADPTSARTLVAKTIPSPLGISCQGFVDAAGRGLVYVAPDGVRTGGEAGALETYRAFYREGPAALGRIEVREGFLAPWLAAEQLHASLGVPEVVRVLREPSPEGVVIKFLSRIPAVARGMDGDGREVTTAPSAAGISQQLAHLEIESVLIPMIGSNGVAKYTLCVSSQVGCAMGCTFCETAQMGLIRSLLPSEIVGQWYVAKHLVSRDEETHRRTDEVKGEETTSPTSSLRLSVSSSLPITNIVFMGMGEPMDNLPNVIAAVGVLKDTNACGMAVSRITISTVGRVDGIRTLAEKIREPGWHRLGIALSLNAPSDAARSKIMPVNRKYNLEAVRSALLDWPEYAGNKICVEYVLIPGENDTRQHAREIAEFIAPFGLHKTATSEPSNGSVRAVLNLIPYNPRRESPWPAPTEEQIEQFMGWLEEEGVFVKRRRTKGRRMMGACGQLGTEQIRRRQLVTPTVSVSREAGAATLPRG
jgi:23S rRNA (adenine2503-C2)-methyltransferase